MIGLEAPKEGRIYNYKKQRVAAPSMTDQQKVHPDVEAPRPQPSSFPLEKGGPPIATMPPPQKQRRCCTKCLCWTLGLLVLLLLIVGATAAIIYLVFQPKLPKYSVDNLRVSDLTLNFDLSLSAKFNVRITADNPNKKIGIYYQKGSRLSVWYKDTNLCQGSIPKFYQGHQNRTVLEVALTGQNQYGRTLLDALQEQQQTGRVPLDLRVNVPVSIKLGGLKLRKVRILGTCMLIVDSLSTNTLISIKASTCHFGLKL
ncbi:Late embryogenesis abundant hydroxyproline-rich glycoprotein family [Perilla frutescens var. frutescens]|nr:Late embryogenesis abundant hydroxyproline-rich glycoprotein family [Perilla frutescens var. frutescens]